MRNRISFMSANYVARQLNYNMTRGWGEGERATSDYFRPLDSFPERFKVILQDVTALGFSAMDIWTAHLSPEWATDAHLESARALLQEYGLTVPSLAGWFGSTRDAFERACEIAVAIECPVLGGSTSLAKKDRDFVVETLQRHGLKLGLENHPEKDPGELLARIGDGGDGTIGATVDTGWFGTQGYDAARALEELAEHLFHVHLKDVLPGEEHITCRFGEGIVPVERCVRVLQKIGYEGAISVEHEPEHSDPTEAVRDSYRMLKEWLGVGEAANG